MNKLEVIWHCEHESYPIVELVTDKPEDEAKKIALDMIDFDDLDLEREDEYGNYVMPTINSIEDLIALSDDWGIWYEYNFYPIATV